MPDNENVRSAAEAARLKVLFEDIRAEIALFDQLDLTDVHPAVVFNPLIGTDDACEQ